MASSTHSTGSARPRTPRTLPAWITSYEASDRADADDTSQLLNAPPKTAAPHHNSTPTDVPRRISHDGYVHSTDPQLDTSAQRKRGIGLSFRQARGAERGRKWDHLRSADPVIVAQYNPNGPEPAWSDLVRSSANPGVPAEKGEVIDYSSLEKLMPNFNRPPMTTAGLHTGDPQVALALFNRESLVPLGLRMTVLMFSLTSLVIAATIVRLGDNPSTPLNPEKTQAIMAVTVDAVAVPYIGYMLYDEYTAKPLGLRLARQKFRLILMDLVFIIFKSASTALAMEVLAKPKDFDGLVNIRLSRALAGLVILGLITWTTTLVLNIQRTVIKLGG